MSERFAVAACQTAFDCPRRREEIGERVRRMVVMAEQAVAGYEPFLDVRLLAFPEFAHAVPTVDSVAKLRKRLAVPIPNEHTDVYAALCRRLGVWIQTGTFLEAHPDHPDVVFNTTCLIGPGGVLSTYRKVNPWIPWELHASPHDVPELAGDPFPVVETEIGRIGCAICYDWLFPETIRALAFRGAEILVRVSAYMDPWGATPPMDWWTLFNRARAVENTAVVVAANQGASLAAYPPFSWPGGSMVVDHDGRILAQADPGPGEKVVVAEVDLAGLRAARERRRGHDMLGHVRSEIHGSWPGGPGGPGGPAADPGSSGSSGSTGFSGDSGLLDGSAIPRRLPAATRHPIDRADIEDRIRQGKQAQRAAADDAVIRGDDDTPGGSG